MLLQKFSLLFSVIFISSSILFAQPDFEWVHQNGGSNHDGGSSAVFDLNGNTISCGTVGLSTSGQVIKRTSTGVVVWTKNFNSSTSIRPSEVDIDANNNTIITGYFNGTVDFNPGGGTFNLTSTSASTDVFILKLDENGVFLWAKKIGGTGSDEAMDLAIDNANNIIVAGRFENTVDFDPGSSVDNETSNGSRDAFILKLDENRNHQWAHAFGGTSFDIGWGVGVDSNNAIFLSGKISGTIDFDPSSSTANLVCDGIFVAKFTAAGSYVWAKSFVGTGSGECISVKISNDGNCYMVGTFTGTVDFDPNAGTYELTSLGAPYHVFILRLNTNGDLNWAKALEGSVSSYSDVHEIIVTSSEDLYLCGNFNDSVNFNLNGADNSMASLDQDFFVLKLDSLSNYQWSISSGSSNSSTAESTGIDVKSNGDFFCTGSFNGTKDFDPSSSSSNLTSTLLDWFELYYSEPCVPSAPVPSVSQLQDVSSNCPIAAPTAPTANNCLGVFSGTSNVSFPIVSSGTTVVTWTYDDLNGHTSTQQQNFIYTPIDTSFSVLATAPYTATATTSGYNYQWYDCDLSSIVSGETNQTFSPSYNANYALIVDNGTCSDTSSCHLIVIDLGIDESALGETFAYFPNPTSGEVNFEFKNVLSRVDLVVLNELGQVVLKNTYFDSAIISVNLKVEPGVYFAELTINSNETKRVKIIKR